MAPESLTSRTRSPFSGKDAGVRTGAVPDPLTRPDELKSLDALRSVDPGWCQLHRMVGAMSGTVVQSCMGISKPSPAYRFALG